MKKKLGPIKKIENLPNRNQEGYFLVIAVVLIMVIGLMASVISYMFSNRAMISGKEFMGLKTFYNAESGLEIGARLLSMAPITGTPTRLTCAALTGTAAVTNASFGGGQLTVSAANSAPTFATSTLSAAVTSAALTIPVSSASGFASHGRIMIDRELIDYADISGNSFIGVTRGAGDSIATNHTSGTSVGQYECSLTSQAAISTIASPSYQRELQWGVQLQNGWVAANVSSKNFELEQWNHSTEMAWNAFALNSSTFAVNLNGISMLSQADGWAVGRGVTTNLVFLHWTGSTWGVVTVTAPCASLNLNGVSMVSSQEGWAVGTTYHVACAGSLFRYLIAKWNGSSWTVLTPSTSPSLPADNATNQTLNDVNVINTDSDGLGNIGFAVGNNGVILEYNGTNWVSMASPTTKVLNSVSVVSANEAWAVGANGTILKFNGTSWSTVTSPSTNTLNEITMLSTNGSTASNGWIVGNNGTILTYNGSTWSSTTVGSNTLLSVSYFNANDVWAVGANGTGIHWDGSSWSTLSTGTSLQLNAISLVSSGSTPVSAWNQVFQ